MLYNYHTHTKRCNHASGGDREYVEKAIEKGLKILGFSDHAPYLFPNTDYQSSFRMRIEQTGDYVSSIRALAKEYEKDIQIFCGFELEYYPDYHKEEMAFLRQFSPDYLIMGQHFLGDELSTTYGQKAEEYALVCYVTQVLAGLSTGDFAYLAHPDLAGYLCSDQCVQTQYKRLCEGAKKMGIPLEINLLGIRDNRYYPKDMFFKIAGEVGNDIILGVDAHNPNDLLETSAEEKAMEMVKKYRLNLVNAPLPMTFLKR